MVLFCLLFIEVSMCLAQETTAETVYSVNLRNETGHLADFIIPITTIRPKVDKLKGYDCITIVTPGEATETWISIFDSTDSLMTGECFGEQESNGYESISDDWPRGKKIFNGVAVRVGAFTDTQIYFIRK